ncbi:hypothetical protein J6590_043129 [Homalodisca vitripennis]|nr:hypothetical protein J6590_043129 [Homalodisca vitripennis]
MSVGCNMPYSPITLSCTRREVLKLSVFPHGQLLVTSMYPRDVLQVGCNMPCSPIILSCTRREVLKLSVFPHGQLLVMSM